MSVTFIYEKKYANGLVDYTDADGNIIDYTPNYTAEERNLIDSTPEELAQDKLRRIANRDSYFEEVARKKQMFLLTKHADIAKPAIRQPLWGNYWAERELCLLAGDTGVGKTTLALEVARHLAGGRVMGNDDNVGKPRTVLYVDFELDNESFYARCADDENLDNLYWAGYNSQGAMPHNLSDACDWMLTTIDGYLKETDAEVLIIDQPDRLHINPQRWRDLMFTLKRLIATRGIAVMVVVNTRPRNYSKPMELSHIYNHRILCPVADSVVGIGANYADYFTRYLKTFKLRNRGLNRNCNADGFSIFEVEETGGSKLQIFSTAPCVEEDMLKPSAAVIRKRKIVSAEAMRHDGMGADDIASHLDVPISTIKRWIKDIEPVYYDSGEPIVGGWEVEEEEAAPPENSPIPIQV